MDGEARGFGDGDGEVDAAVIVAAGLDGDGAAVAEDEDGGDDDNEETAAEKRLRLAKAYLSSLRAELAAEREGDDDEEDEEGDARGAVGDATVAQRLAADAQVLRGETQRPLAARVRVPSATEPQSGTLWKGHSRPVTAVALSADDTRAAAAAKDGVVLLYDVETGARTRLPQAPPVPTQNVRVSRSRVARHLSCARLVRPKLGVCAHPTGVLSGAMCATAKWGIVFVGCCAQFRWTVAGHWRPGQARQRVRHPTATGAPCRMLPWTP